MRLDGGQLLFQLLIALLLVRRQLATPRLRRRVHLLLRHQSDLTADTECVSPVERSTGLLDLVAELGQGKLRAASLLVGDQRVHLARISFVAGFPRGERR